MMMGGLAPLSMSAGQQPVPPATVLAGRPGEREWAAAVPRSAPVLQGLEPLADRRGDPADPTGFGQSGAITTAADARHPGRSAQQDPASGWLTRMRG